MDLNAGEKAQNTVKVFVVVFQKKPC
jgi:hypothetical protein